MTPLQLTEGGRTSWRHGLTTRIVLGASPCIQEAHPPSAQWRDDTGMIPHNTLSPREAARVLWYSIVLENPSPGRYADPKAPYIPREKFFSNVLYHEVSHKFLPLSLAPALAPNPWLELGDAPTRWVHLRIPTMGQTRTQEPRPGREAGRNRQGKGSLTPALAPNPWLELEDSPTPRRSVYILIPTMGRTRVQEPRTKRETGRDRQGKASRHFN